MQIRKMLTNTQKARLRVKSVEVFLQHTRFISYADLIILAVGPNAFRAYPRVNKMKDGASKVFRTYLVDERCEIIRKLKAIRSESALHKFECLLQREVIRRLTNVRPDRLVSFNKTRKLIDLYVENLVTMCPELQSVRARLVPWLFLPLDSQMMNHPDVFSDAQLQAVGLKRGATFSSVKTEEQYLELQRRAAVNAQLIGKNGRPFYRVYLDLLWNDRYQRDGSNLLECNPS